MRQYGQILVKTAFRATITTKGIDGLFEIMGGACLWFIHSSAMSSILGILKVFASIFLLSHGVTKVILVIALWRNAPWAYPLTIVLFGVFGAYQMYRFSHAHSIPMLLFTISDVFLIFLTLREWQTRIS